jgi:hypothetical protein
MKYKKYIILLLPVLILSSCIVSFIPETDEDKDMLVVEGLITDQPGPYVIKLSKSQPLGTKESAKPVKGWQVKVLDDIGGIYTFTEKATGTYVSDPVKFRGIVGRSYTLSIRSSNTPQLTFESLPVELKKVPPIDSIYYEKKILKEGTNGGLPDEGCEVYLDTHDPENKSRFYRWEFNETWEFRLPFDVPNSRCWLSYNSVKINVKSTKAFAEDRVTKYPINFISNTSDRLKQKYSMLISQYSLSEDEFNYWDKLQNVTQQVGGLYDITPATIPSNIWCNEDPNELVLGYFSVSAVASKRIFIKDVFFGQINLYNDCISDTVSGSGVIPNLGVSVWVVLTLNDAFPPKRVLTDKQGCADCTVRGSKIKPLYWEDSK